VFTHREELLHSSSTCNMLWWPKTLNCCVARFDGVAMLLLDWRVYHGSRWFSGTHVFSFPFLFSLVALRYMLAKKKKECVSSDFIFILVIVLIWLIFLFIFIPLNFYLIFILYLALILFVAIFFSSISSFEIYFDLVFILNSVLILLITIFFYLISSLEILFNIIFGLCFLIVIFISIF
jgi:hypothetical protein